MHMHIFMYMHIVMHMHILMHMHIFMHMNIFMQLCFFFIQTSWVLIVIYSLTKRGMSAEVMFRCNSQR